MAPKLVRAPSQLKEDMLVLFDLESASGDSVIGRRFRAHSRIEDLGYILVWIALARRGRWNALSNHARRIAESSSGSSGMRGTRRDDTTLFSRPFLAVSLRLSQRPPRRCVHGILHSLVMQNAARELFLLVPN